MSKEFEELQEIARVATSAELENYEPIPAEWNENLTLGTFFEGNDRIFELYIAQEKPSEAILISSARINRSTKQVSVSISNLRRKVEL